MEKTKLPEPFRTDWINALRSGEYKQCTMTLHKDGCFCVWGVAGIVQGLKPDHMTPYCYPREAGIEKYLTHKEYNHIFGLNDHEGWTFSEIADYIEQNH